MNALQQMTESIGDVVVWFAVLVTFMVFATRRAMVAVKDLRFSSFCRNADGVYPLSLVLALPFYCLVIATIVECALMMVVKVGTMNAAYAAARSAIVWRGSEASGPHQYRMIRLAASQAMVPYASSKPLHLQPTGARPSDFSSIASPFFDAYETYSGGGASQGYIDRKLQFALAATRVDVQEETQPGLDYTSDLRVTVTFEKPVDLPVVGTFLGSRASWGGARFFSRRIQSTVVLQKEGAKSKTRTLGIEYDSEDI